MTTPLGEGELRIETAGSLLQFTLAIDQRQWRFLLDDRSVAKLILELRSCLRQMRNLSNEEEIADTTGTD